MNEHVMQKRWTRATQMIFMAAMLSGSAACNTISGADSIQLIGPGDHGSSVVAGSGTDSIPPMEEREQLRCEEHYVMVGVEGRYGSWIDSVSVNCAELKGDGNLGNLRPTKVAGAMITANQDPLSTGCDPGQVVGELEYTHDKQNKIYLFQVHVGCATVYDRKNSDRVSYTSYRGTYNPEHADETPVSFACKQGEIADGVDVVVGEDDMKIHVRSFVSLHCIPAP